MKTKILLALLVSLFHLPFSWALTRGVHQLVEFETKANAAALRSDQEVLMPHLEIPIEMVGVDFAQRLDPKIRESLVVQHDGKTYVRWIISPEGMRYGQELIDYYATKGISLKFQYLFKGYRTASRSYIVENPQNGAQLSMKTSADLQEGPWPAKVQFDGEAKDARLISDFLYKQNQLRPFENFIVMDEPAILHVRYLNRAMIIRDLGELKQADNKKFYLPGFSALHEEVGAKIAARNGSNDPFDFWSKNYVMVAGRALGELAARTGLQFDSPHSQNFLIELDENLKPTGKLVLRDLSDMYVYRQFMEALEGENSPLLENYDQRGNIRNFIEGGFQPFHGNQKPSWVSEAQHSTWAHLFFNSFDASFQHISGYSLSHATNLQPYQDKNKFFNTYKLDDKPAYNNLFSALKSNGYVTGPSNYVRCESVFSMRSPK